MSRLLRITISILGVIAIGIICFAVSFLFWKNRWQEDVSDRPPHEFPAVVVTSKAAELILYSGRESFESEYKEYSFTIPTGRVALINEQLRRSQAERGAKGYPEIRVSQISEDRQFIELEILGDGLFESSYEASEKEIRPLKLMLTGPLFIFYPAATTLVFVLGSFLGFSAARRILKRRFL